MMAEGMLGLAFTVLYVEQLEPQALFDFTQILPEQEKELPKFTVMLVEVVVNVVQPDPTIVTPQGTVHV